MYQKICAAIIESILALVVVVPVFYATNPRMALYSYVRTENFWAIQNMLQQGFSLEMQDDRGFTPVCEAIEYRDQRALDILTSFGANPNPDCIVNLPPELVQYMRAQPMVGHLSPVDPPLFW